MDDTRGRITRDGIRIYEDADFAGMRTAGQIAAEIRAVRPPEPYKGKGIRYADEKITIKETKKK